MQKFLCCQFKQYYVENQHTPINSFNNQKYHKRFEPHRKYSLINFVISENISTQQAAQKLQINDSASKYIMKNFKNNNNWLEENQNPQRNKNTLFQWLILQSVYPMDCQISQRNQKINYCDSLQQQYKNHYVQYDISQFMREFCDTFHYQVNEVQEMLKRFYFSNILCQSNNDKIIYNIFI